MESQVDTFYSLSTVTKPKHHGMTWIIKPIVMNKLVAVLQFVAHKYRLGLTTSVATLTEHEHCDLF